MNELFPIPCQSISHAHIKNISINEMRRILTRLGLSKVRTKGGHESWMKDGMSRPVIIQTHVDPIPEFIVRNALRTMGITKEEFITML